MNVESSIEPGTSFDADDADHYRRRRSRIVKGIILVAIVLAALFAYRLLTSNKKPPSVPAPQTVSVTIPGRQQVDAAISATGSLAARREMPVGVAGEGGMISRVLVEAGDWVGAGQVLATIDRSVQAQQAAQIAAQINAARANAALAQAELDRAMALVARGFISKADIDRKRATRDSANAQVRVAQAQYAEINARIGRLDIRAPAAGLVLERNVEPGQVVSAGSGMLFRMAKGGEIELKAQLAESDLGQLHVGNRAMVTPVGSDRSFEGQVWQIAPVVNPQTRQGEVRVALSYDPLLRPGGFASAKLVGGTVTVPLVPESAVMGDAKSAYVLIVRPDNVVEKRPVTTGIVTASGIAILSGLAGNEQVVLLAGAFLNPGEKVTPERVAPTAQAGKPVPLAPAAAAAAPMGKPAAAAR